MKLFREAIGCETKFLCLHQGVSMGNCIPFGLPLSMPYIQGGDDKSLARPGRKQATTTELGIYSTYPHDNTLLNQLL
jgi:hypothetical protein